MAKARYHWLTRPQADSETLAQQLAAEGVETLMSPIMQIALRDVAPPQTLPDAIILTSRHARHILAKLPPQARTLPVFCVGSATALSAQSLGYHTVITGEADVLSLLPQLLATIPEGGNLLYLSGEDVRVDIPTLLKAQKRNVERVITYAADRVESLTTECIEALMSDQIGSVSFFSARSAELAVQLLRHHQLQHTASSIDAYCLSLPVAEATATSPWKSVQVCASPTSAAMRDLIVSRHAQTML